MSNVKVSAFAKRRRLNDGSAVTAVEAAASDSSVSFKVVDKKTVRKKAKNRGDTCVDEPPLSDVGLDSPESPPGANSFEPLVETRAVKFSGIREVDLIGRDCCKIRLSREQECSIVGVAKLWVRDGSINVYGATIAESPSVYTVFAPHNDNVTRIKAVTKTAEFQLESINASAGAEPSVTNLPGIRKDQHNDLSFSIVDFGELSLAEGKYRNNHAIRVNPDLGHVLRLQKQQVLNDHARVVVAGKRPSNTAYAAINVVNTLLTNSTADASKTVAILDLDPSSPLRYCPGTISLIYQRHLTLGPPHAYPLSTKMLNDSELDHSVYVGYAEDDDEKVVIEFVEQVSKSHPDIQKMPLVVRTGKWLASANPSSLAKLRKLLDPTLILSIDRTKSAATFEAATMLADGNVRFEHIPDFAIANVPSLKDHRNKLRSHLLLHEYIDQTTWYLDLASVPEKAKLSLTVGSDTSQLKFVLVSGGMIRMQDLGDILVHTLVSIVARDSHGMEDVSSFRIQQFQRSSDIRHIAVGFVESIDENHENFTIKIVTNADGNVIDCCHSKGLILGLILERPGPDGQFSRYMLRD